MFDFIPAVLAAETPPDGGVVGLFGLNWKLFLAQLINFGLVVLVLWRWVFKPVTTALEKRTKKIEQSLLDADHVKRQRAELEEYKKEQQKKARADYQNLLLEVERVAGQQKEKILSDARKEAEALIAQARERTNEERAHMVKELKAQFSEFVVLAVEKVISEKMNKTIDARYIEKTMSTLQ